MSYFAFTARNFYFYYKIGGTSEKCKTCRLPSLDLDLSFFVEFFKIYLVTKSLFKSIFRR
jgi:hypothetical protein